MQRRVQNDQDAEEIVQNALLTISQKYRAVEIERSFAGWAYQVLQNKSLDFWKSAGSRHRHNQSLDDTLDIVAPVELDHDVRDRMLACLNKIGRANPRFARILNLHYQGYTTEEICSRLDLRRDYIYVVLARARAMFDECLKDE